MKIIQDSIDAEGLATVIMAPNRTKPICVITASLESSEPFVNPTALEDELGSLCDFYYIDDPRAVCHLFHGHAQGLADVDHVLLKMVESMRMVDGLVSGGRAFGDL